MLLNYRMRFYIALFFCLVLTLPACNSDEDTPPGIIELHHMASLLTDVAIIDGSLNNLSQQPDTLRLHGLHLYIAVFKLHHTDSVQFKKSLQYYANRPDLLVRIYDGVNHRLSKKLDSVQKQAILPRKQITAPNIQQQHVIPPK